MSTRQGFITDLLSLYIGVHIRSSCYGMTYIQNQSTLFKHYLQYSITKDNSKLDTNKAQLSLTLVEVERLVPVLLLFGTVPVSLMKKLLTVEFSPGPGEVVEAFSGVDEVLKIILWEGLRASTLFNILNM